MCVSCRRKFIQCVAATFVVVFAVLLLWLVHGQTVFADEVDDAEKALWEEVESGLSAIDFSDFDSVGFDFVGGTLSKIKQIISGEYDSAEAFWQYLLNSFAGELSKVLPTILVIFAIIVVAGLSRKTGKTVLASGTNNAVSFVASVLIAVHIASVVIVVYKNTYAVIYQIKALCDAFSPIAITLLVAIGANATSTACSPALTMYSSLVISVICNVILPASVFALIFAVAANFSSDVKVEKTSKFCAGFCGWSLGLIFMIFSAFAMVQGVAAAKTDGVSIRLAKFATKSYVPIVGGYFVEGFDMVMASSSLIKNAFGVLALIVIVGLIVKPIVYLLTMKLGFSALSAFCEPFADEKQIKLLDQVCGCLTLPVAILAAVAFMFAVVVWIVMSCNPF